MHKNRVKRENLRDFLRKSPHLAQILTLVWAGFQELKHELFFAVSAPTSRLPKTLENNSKETKRLLLSKKRSGGQTPMGHMYGQACMQGLMDYFLL